MRGCAVELAPDFVMRPLSNVEDDDEGGKGFSAAAVKEAKPAAGILGRWPGSRESGAAPVST